MAARVLRRLGLRARLFLVSLILLAICGGSSAVWLEAQVRGSVETELRQRLEQQAVLLALATGDVDSPVQWQRMTAQAHERTHTRFSMLTLDGTVVSDSLLDGAAVAALDNHADRPEIQKALQGEVGIAQRMSATMQMEMLYVAVPWPQEQPRMVVRAAVSMSSLQQSIRQLRTRLLVAGVMGMLVAVLMSGLASHWVSRDLRTLLQQVRQLSESKESGRLHLPTPTPGELTPLVGSFNRLSEELEQTVAALTSERHRLGAVLEGMSDAVIAVDQERRITLVNPTAIRLFQPRSSPLGQPLVSLIRASHVHEMVAAAIKGRDGETEFELSVQPPRQIQVTITTQQRGLGCVLICRDVTGLRLLERMRRDFITNVSHELRTPVTIVRANAETLLEGAINDEKHGPIFVQAILRNAERLERLIDGLLNLSSLENGRVELSIHEVSLNKIVQQVCSSLETRATDREQTLHFEVPEALVVLADAQALEQILTNLTDNAIKYSPPMSAIQVEAWREPEDGWIRLEVTDTGPGIAEHHQNRIFERFYRVDAGRAKKMGGSGLGLSIVKHLAEAMDCRLGLTSEPPHGTTFWLLIPEATQSLGED